MYIQNISFAKLCLFSGSCGFEVDNVECLPFTQKSTKIKETRAEIVKFECVYKIEIIVLRAS